MIEFILIVASGIITLAILVGIYGRRRPKCLHLDADERNWTDPLGNIIMEWKCPDCGGQGVLTLPK